MIRGVIPQRGAGPAGRAGGEPGPPPGGMRGDDALARAAADVAAPRRRLLAALRDAHAEACLRLVMLRRCAAALDGEDGPLRALLAVLLGQGEEQLRRLEILFAMLRERPGAGLAAASGPDAAAILASGQAGRREAALHVLLATEASGAEEARRLRDMAWPAGQTLAMRLLDQTAAERAQATLAIALLMRRQRGCGAALH